MKAHASRQSRLIPGGLSAAGRRLLCGALLSVGGLAWGGESPADDLLPRASMTSSDGGFEVFAPSSRLGLRWPVLQFADRFGDEFFRVTRLARGRVEHPIVIRLGSDTNDLRVVSGTVPGLTGGEREWIELPDPDHADLDELRLALTHALVREWLRSQAINRRPLPEPPVWLLAGMARYVGSGHRIADLDDVRMQWLRGRLPTLEEIFSGEPPVAARHPALQAVLADWLLNRPEEPFGALLRRVAEGAAWSPALLAEVLRRSRISALEEDWDAWQVDVAHKIRQPGLTTPGTVQAFRAQLAIYPGDWGLPFADAWRGREPAECLGWPATPQTQAALRGKAGSIRLFAVGRDATLQRVAAAYGNFFEALAAGEDRDRLRNMLAQAEELRRQIESRAAKGEMLYNPISPTGAPLRDGTKSPRPAL